MAAKICGVGLLALAFIASGVAAFDANSDIALDLSAGACTAFEVDDLSHKFSYDVELVALLGICLPQNISISKLYIQDACINRRDNELGLNSFELPLCAAAKDSSASVCESVFASGPSDALLTAANLTAGQNFDSGAVCANTQTAYIYVKNDCPLPSRATIRVNTRNYDGKVCITVAGKTLSGVAIAIIAVGALIALIVFCSLVLCCCRCLCV